MGKNIKGKELGEGISQRKDGFYVARFRLGKDLQGLNNFRYKPIKSKMVSNLRKKWCQNGVKFTLPSPKNPRIRR